jgi:tetratricopeptide (TPR) repeat protein
MARRMLESSAGRRHGAAKLMRHSAKWTEGSNRSSVAEISNHLSIEAMANLMTTLSSPAVPTDSGEIAACRHLLSVCPTCRGVYEQLEARSRELWHWNLAAVMAEADAAPALWALLEEMPYRRQLEMVRSEARFHTWGFALHCLRRSAAGAVGTVCTAAQPKQAAEAANLALAAADALDASYDEEWIEDLAALALAHLAAARREMGEMAGANDAIDQAWQRWAGGTEGPAVEARILAAEALVRRDEGRLEEAGELLGRVHAITTEPDATEATSYDPHLGGVALLHSAWCLYHLGRTEEAAAALDRAEGLLDPGREPSLALALRCGRARCLVRLGFMEEAAAGVGAAIELARAAGDRAAELRMRVAQARLTGEPAAAEARLRGAAQGFLEMDLGVDAALAFLELADVLVRAGDPAPIPALAAEVLPAWSSPEIQRQENAALLLFQQACETGRLTSELVRQLAAVLERSRRPSLAWWSAWGTVLGKETAG